MLCTAPRLIAIAVRSKEHLSSHTQGWAPQTAQHLDELSHKLQNDLMEKARFRFSLIVLMFCSPTQFVESLDVLTNPEHKFKDWIHDVSPLLALPKSTEARLYMTTRFC